MNNQSLLLTSELMATLQRLRDEGERCRMELYWNVQRLHRTERRSRSLRQLSSIRIHRGELLEILPAIVRWKSPVVNRGYCPRAKAS